MPIIHDLDPGYVAPTAPAARPARAVFGGGANTESTAFAPPTTPLYNSSPEAVLFGIGNGQTSGDRYQQGPWVESGSQAIQPSTLVDPNNPSSLPGWNQFVQGATGNGGVGQWGAGASSGGAPGATPGGNSGGTFGGSTSSGSYSSVPSTPTYDSRQRLEQALMSRLQPQFDRQSDRTRNTLLTSGIEVGSDAYNNQMESLGRQQNDALLGVIAAGGQEESRATQLAATLQQQQFAQWLQGGQFANATQAQQYGQDLSTAQFDNATRAQQLQEELTQRQLALNDIRSLLGTSSASMPASNSYYTANAQAPDILGAANAQSNANAQASANRGATYSSLANLGLGLANLYWGG